MHSASGSTGAWTAHAPPTSLRQHTQLTLLHHPLSPLQLCPTHRPRSSRQLRRQLHPIHHQLHPIHRQLHPIHQQQSRLHTTHQPTPRHPSPVNRHPDSGVRPGSRHHHWGGWLGLQGWVPVCCMGPSRTRSAPCGGEDIGCVGYVLYAMSLYACGCWSCCKTTCLTSSYAMSCE